MPLTTEDWQSIYNYFRRQRNLTEFIQGKVIKTDETNRLVYIKELGDQPIPIIAFEYEVTYYDTLPRIHASGPVIEGVATVAVENEVNKRTVYVKPRLPKPGDVVLCAIQYGQNRLPKCLGVVQSRNYVKDAAIVRDPLADD